MKRFILALAAAGIAWWIWIAATTPDYGPRCTTAAGACF